MGSTGTPISDVGEFGLIERIHSSLAGHGSDRVEVGPGDDAAVVRANWSASSPEHLQASVAR